MVGQLAINQTAGPNYLNVAIWPTANLAKFVPVIVPVTVTVKKMVFWVGTSSGNYDIGIYDEHANRLVSLGSTAMPAAGIVVTDITDTTIGPGVYFLALVVSNTTATVGRIQPTSGRLTQACGVMQQATALPLPDPAVFATPGAYTPFIHALAVTAV